MHAIPRSLLLALLLLFLAPAQAARDFLVDADWLAAERDNNWNVYTTAIVRKEEPYFYAATALKEEPVIATAADVAAARWIVRNTPADARFIVGTTHWHVSTFRGVDGGYWLPLLARRQTNVPPALYPYGSPAVVEAITRHCRIALRGDDLADSELLDLLQETGAEYVYIGPAGRDVTIRWQLPGEATPHQYVGAVMVGLN